MLITQKLDSMLITQKTRRDRKKLVADLDSAPQSYPKIVLNLSATKILLNSVINEQTLKQVQLKTELAMLFARPYFIFTLQICVKTVDCVK